MIRVVHFHANVHNFYFVDPALGQGFMHITEGWLLFVVSFSCIASIGWLGAVTERRWTSRGEVLEP